MLLVVFIPDLFHVTPIKTRALGFHSLKNLVKLLALPYISAASGRHTGRHPFLVAIWFRVGELSA
jgi:hypothetical protein